MASREQYVFLAKLAEQAERYEEMVSFMEKVVTSTAVDSSEGLTAEERNLLSVAYKNLIGARRASWRIVTSIEQKEEKNSEVNIGLIRNYKKNIEGDLTEICQGILKLLDSALVPTATTGESKVFYLKMKGDYHRYLAEFMSGKDKLKAGEDTLKAYKTAQEIANKELIPTHPLKLGLALNFSVFYYEIEKSPDKACDLAKKAYEEAVAEIDTLPEDSFKDSTLIIQLLRDNLTLWSVDMQEDDLFEIKEASDQAE